LRIWINHHGKHCIDFGRRKGDHQFCAIANFGELEQLNPEIDGSPSYVTQYGVPAGSFQSLERYSFLRLYSVIRIKRSVKRNALGETPAPSFIEFGIAFRERTPSPNGRNKARGRFE
jgi:hypothetical protein